MKSSAPLSEKTCIVTGANAGIGKATALSLAQMGLNVVMVCRNQSRGKSSQEEIIAKSGNRAVDLMLADMSSQKSIYRFVEEFRAKYQRLHILINNAANFDLSLKEPTLTKEGVELIFATNHLGPFLMTNLLLDTLKTSAPARILNVASKGLVAHPRLAIEFDDLNQTKRKRYSPSHAYYHSKLAQVMFTYTLAQRLHGTGVSANCIRVPAVAVDIGRLGNIPRILLSLYRFKMRFSITPEEMGKTYAYLATNPELEGISGKQFDEHYKEVGSSMPSRDGAAQQRLWRVSLQLTGLM
ncbi:MAG: SDR family oxidoreductase [Anaerolineae bacterium]|nr:SDR family oxidoreductase [Anaerolineae bacterium]